MSDDGNTPKDPPKKRHIGRKLLIAAVGVATVNYVACIQTTSGNLVAPPIDAGADAATDAAVPDAIVMSGNLIAPPPPDAGPEGGNSDGGNGG